MKRIFLTIAIAAFAAIEIYAQVGINTNAPNAKTALEVVSSDSTKGIMIPRMTEAQRNAIVIDANKDNSLMIYNINEDCYNYYSKEAGEWQSLCGKSGKSEFKITDCNNVSIKGVYQDGVALTSANFMIISVNVAKIGSYTITVKPDPSNGYYFYTEGEFLTTGPVNVMVPALGTPTNYTPDGVPGDSLLISLNGIVSSCHPCLKIENTTIRPHFAIACTSVTVNGVYKKNVVLDATNTITMRLNVNAGSTGATYSVSTDMIDGISFSGSGVLGAAGPQEITLYGTGTTYNTTAKHFTVTTNSESTTATCQATVVPVIAAKGIIAAGSLTYGLTSGGVNGCEGMLKENMNYGDNENSIVKYEGFTTIQTATALTNVSAWTTNANKGRPYDIIVITYDLTPTPAQRTSLLNYVNNGGVLIYLDQNYGTGDGENNAAMIGAIFGETLSNPVNVTGASTNDMIKITSSIDDEITNGPFGDVRDLQWGIDNDNSCGLEEIPYGAIVYSGSVNASTGISTNTARVTMLRHPTRNFFWCGDSGLIAGNNGTSNSSYPLRTESRIINSVTHPHYPVDKPNYGSATPRKPVCNSTLFANVMAWALRMAEENGINSGQ
jgi:hypothetical protein